MEYRNRAARISLTRVLHSLASHRRLGAAEALVLTILALFVYTHALLSVEFFPDELYWIMTSPRLDRFIQGDFSAASWPEGFGSYEIRPIPSYVVAIGQGLASISPSDLPQEPWDWSASLAANAAMGRIPNDRLLYYSRLPMAVVGALGVVLAGWLVAYSHSRLAGYLFTAVGLGSPYLLVLLRRAMSEACLLLITLLALAAISRLVTELRSGMVPRAMLLSVAVGILSGLAGESKLIGLSCVPVAVAVTFARLNRFPAHARYRLRWPVVSAIVIVLTAAASFIASYPFLYHDTTRHLAETIVARLTLVSEQLAYYRGEVIMPDQRAAILLERIFAGPIGLPAAGAYLPLILVPLGLGVGGVLIAARGSRAPTGQADMLTVWIMAAICLGVPMLSTPLDWDRYYLYPVLFAFVFVSIGLAEVVLTPLRSVAGHQASSIPRHG